MPIVAETLINSSMRRSSKPFRRPAATAAPMVPQVPCGWTAIFICAARLMRELTS
jgi:hypothetical protein